MYRSESHMEHYHIYIFRNIIATDEHSTESEVVIVVSENGSLIRKDQVSNIEPPHR